MVIPREQLDNYQTRMKQEFLISYDLFWIKSLINWDQNICVHLARLSILWLYFYYPTIVLLNS